MQRNSFSWVPWDPRFKLHISVQRQRIHILWILTKLHQFEGNGKNKWLTPESRNQSSSKANFEKRWCCKVARFSACIVDTWVMMTYGQCMRKNPPSQTNLNILYLEKLGCTWFWTEHTSFKTYKAEKIVQSYNMLMDPAFQEGYKQGVKRLSNFLVLKNFF